MSIATSLQKSQKSVIFANMERRGRRVPTVAAAMGTHLRGRCIVETRCTTFLQYAAQIIRNRKIRIRLAHRAKNCTFAAEKLLKYGYFYLLFSGLHGG